MQLAGIRVYQAFARQNESGISCTDYGSGGPGGGGGGYGAEESKPHL